MNKEQWIKWEPIDGLDTVYTITEVVNNLEEFNILLIDPKNDKKKIQVLFEDSVDAYRYTEECYRLNIDSLFTQPNGKNLYGVWGFFKVLNSSYLHWLEEESSGFFNEKFSTHYVFVAGNCIVDVATIGDPKVEFIK